MNVRATIQERIINSWSQCFAFYLFIYSLHFIFECMPLDTERTGEVFNSNLTRLAFFILNLINYLLGKSGLVFPKLTKVTIHMNSTLSRNTRQNNNS